MLTFASENENQIITKTQVLRYGKGNYGNNY